MVYNNFENALASPRLSRDAESMLLKRRECALAETQERWNAEKNESVCTRARRGGGCCYAGAYGSLEGDILNGDRPARRRIPRPSRRRAPRPPRPPPINPTLSPNASETRRYLTRHHRTCYLA
jgi:hypothetical protein